MGSGSSWLTCAGQLPEKESSDSDQSLKSHRWKGCWFMCPRKLWQCTECVAFYLYIGETDLVSQLENQSFFPDSTVVANSIDNVEYR